MWKLALIWIGAVILFFALWSLAAKLLCRISEKKSLKKQQDKEDDKPSDDIENQQTES